MPVYGPYNTFIGTGVVGGRVPTFLAMGQTAGGIVNNLLEGRPVSGLPAIMPTQLSVDWRQIERWGIDKSAVPADALVQFRAPSFWDQYRSAALITLGIVLLPVRPSGLASVRTPGAQEGRDRRQQAPLRARTRLEARRRRRADGGDRA